MILNTIMESISRGRAEYDAKYARRKSAEVSEPADTAPAEAAPAPAPAALVPAPAPEAAEAVAPAGT
jgi:hypothetical protein